MIGAIAGDIAGSIYEGSPNKPTDVSLGGARSRFTDDTVMTLAVADAILHGQSYAVTLQHWGRRYPDCGYGGMFRRWLWSDDPKPYGSYGNGSGMRVGPVGWAFDEYEEVLAQAAASAAVTHDHPEGIKGAQAVAGAVFLARTTKDKEGLRRRIAGEFDYDLGRSIAGIRPTYGFDVTCQGSVPEAIIAFLDSEDLESAIRLAISLGGDTDTIACMAGAIAQAYYESVPQQLHDLVYQKLTPELAELLDAFCARFQVAGHLPVSTRS